MILPYIGCIAIVSLSWKLENFINQRILYIILSLSSASYIIYLFHTTFEGLVKGLLWKFAPMLPFWALTFLVVNSGTLIPWWINDNILSRYNITRILFGIGKR